MRKRDFLAKEFEKIIRDYDEDHELIEDDYRRLSHLFSAVVRTNPEVRSLFFDQVREVSIKMRRVFDEINRNLTNNGAEKKDKIFN